MKNRIELLNKALKNNWFMLQFVWKACPIYLLCNILFTLITHINNLFLSVLLIQIIFNAIETKVVFSDILMIIGIVILIELAYNIFGCWFQAYFQLKMGNKIRGYIVPVFLNKVSTMELACYEETEFYNKYTVAMSETVERAFEVLNTIGNLLGRILSFCIALGVIFSLDLYAFLIAFIPVVISLMVNNNLMHVQYEKNINAVHPNRKMDYIKRLLLLPDHAKEIRTTNIFQTILLKMPLIRIEFETNIKKYGFKIGVLGASGNILVNTIISIISYIYVIIKYMFSDSLLIGDFLALTISISYVSNILYEINQSFISISNNGIYIENLRSFLQYEPKISNNPDAKKDFPEKFTLSISDLNFKYDSSHGMNLKNINLEIHSNEKIAFVGYNGAGKSTLIKLLLRLYEPTSGTIKINGLNINSYDIKHYRNQFSVIFQDYKIFAMSVVENMLMKEYTDNYEERINVSLRKAGLSERIKQLQNGIYTNVTKEFDDNGVILSGGEEQKLAISRLFVQEAKILILDEPTSALDPIAEYNLYENIISHNQLSTVLFSSHRLSSAVLADRIYYFEQGKIVEVGSHAELMKLKGKYYELFCTQSKNYKMDAEVV